MAFIIRHKDTGHYAKKHGGTEDFRKARVYSRRCDITNSLKRRGASLDSYEVIQLKPDFVPVHARIISRIPLGLPDIVCASHAEAHALVAELSKKHHIHTDYFSVVNTLDHITERKAPRPSWDAFFMGLAHAVAVRSHDIHTKVGCIIVNDEHHIIGTGYNGFPAGMCDAALPLNRPDAKNPDADHKHNWMIHAELNALANCTVNPKGSTVYLTIEPCHSCSMYMKQQGVGKVLYYGEYKSMTDIQRQRRAILNLEIRRISCDLSWLSLKT